MYEDIPEALDYEPGFGEEALERALSDWIEHEPAPPITRKYLLDSFHQSQVVDRLTRESSRVFDFRASHSLLLARLQSSPGNVQRLRALALIRTASRGFPLPLAEVLLRFLAGLGRETSHEATFSEAVRILGELPLHDEPWIDEVLRRYLADPRSRVRRAAAVGLYRRAADTNANGFAETLGPLLRSLPQTERLLTLFEAGGLLTSARLMADEEFLVQESAEIAKRVRALAPIAFPTTNMADVNWALGQGDFCSAAISVGVESLEAQPCPARELLRAVADLEIRPNVHPDVLPQSMLNSALACIKLGRREEAERLAQEVWTNAAHRGPSLLIPALEILAVANCLTLSQVDRASQWLRGAYRLSSADAERLQSLAGNLE